MDSTKEKELVIDVEVCQRADSILSKEIIEEAVKTEIITRKYIFLGTVLSGENYVNTLLRDHVDSVHIDVDSLQYLSCTEKDEDSDFIYKYHVYRLTQEGAAKETINSDSDELSVASHWLLPAQEFHNLWDNLFYECEIKYNLLRFVETTMLFSDHSVNPNIISCNKVILLHGPPGSGKTSLCKALAQKIAIRMGDRYTHVQLVEINSHSLFSKWFSESGKLVMKLFDEIRNMAKNEKALICILIDEVESLAHARKLCINGNEPSDSIRVVNALLTQLDQIKRYRNVLILTTSNMTEAIDLAFVDRADMKLYLGYPGTIAIYSIYRSCLRELMRSEILEEEGMIVTSQISDYVPDLPHDNGARLLEICKMSKGLTGRTLRKIPFLAYSLHLPTLCYRKKVKLSEFLTAMHAAIIKQKQEAHQQEPQQQETHQQGPQQQESHQQEPHQQKSHQQEPHQQESHQQEPHQQKSHQQEPHQQKSHQQEPHQQEPQQQS